MPEKRPRTTDEYDLFCRGRLANPYPFFHQLRSDDPVHWSESLNSSILSRYSDVRSALRHQRLSASRVGVFMNQLPETMRVTLDPLGRHLSQWVSMSDPPAHTRLRRLVNKAFTPGIVEGMRGHVQEIVDNLLDGIQSKGKADLIADFAYELPATVISEMLGVPVQDRDRFKGWAEDVMAFTGGGALALPEIAEQSQKSLFEMYGYFGGIIADRRSRPQDDLISALSRVEEQGDMLTEEELLGICDQLLTAGHDTTRNL